MKQKLWIYLSFLATVSLIACGKSGGGSDNGPGTNTPVIVNPTAIIQTTNLAYFADNWSDQRSITITDQQAYREFLRTSMGVCDRTVNTGGTANCSAWITGGLDVVITVADVATNKLAATFRTWPQMNANYNYYYQLPANGLAGWIQGFFGGYGGQTAGAYYNPLALGDFEVSAWNNSQGFEARSYGPLYGFGNRSLIQIQVQNGHLGDDTFTFKLGYPNCVQDTYHTCSSPKGVWFATGTFKRCQTANCAVPNGMW